MALDKEYFDGINIDVVKKKYYNANKVHVLLEDIRSQAEALSAENELLKKQLREMEQHKTEIGDTLLAAQASAREIVAKANERAAEIVEQAQQQRAALLDGAFQQQEQTVSFMAETFDKLKKQQTENIRLLNGMWQEFLCSLSTDNPGTEPASSQGNKAAQEKERIDELENMVNNIAKELMEIMGS